MVAGFFVAVVVAGFDVAVVFVVSGFGAADVVVSGFGVAIVVSAGLGTEVATELSSVAGVSSGLYVVDVITVSDTVASVALAVLLFSAFDCSVSSDEITSQSLYRTKHQDYLHFCCMNITKEMLRAIK